MKSALVFRENVKKLMQKRGMKVKDLASMVGLSPSYLSLILSGERENLSDFHKDAIALALGVSVWELFREDTDLEEQPVIPSREAVSQLAPSGIPEAILAVDDLLLALGVDDLAFKSALYRRLNALSAQELSKLGAVIRGTLEDWNKIRASQSRDKVPAGTTADSRGAVPAQFRQAGRFGDVLVDEDLRTLAAALSLTVEIPGGIPIDVLVEALRWPVARVVAGLERFCEAGLAFLTKDEEGGLVAGVNQDDFWRWTRKHHPAGRLKQLCSSLARALKDLGRDDLSHHIAALFLTAGELERAREYFRKAWEQSLEGRQWSRARGFLEVELGLLRILDAHPSEKAYCYGMLATCCMELGEAVEARENQLKALDIWRSLDRVAETVLALEFLAVVEARLGSWDRAQKAIEAALELARTGEEEARLRCVLGEILLERGHLGRAKAELEKALDLSRTIDYLSGLQRSLLGLGVLSVEKGRFEEAKTSLSRVLALSEKGDRKAGLKARLELGRLFLAQGKGSLALEQFEEARKLARKLDDAESLGMAVAGVARSLILLRRPGDLAQILPELEEALALFERTKMVKGLVPVLIAQAEVLSTRGLKTQASDLFKRAIRIAQEHGAPSLEATACHAYATFMKEEGDPLYRVMEERANWLRATMR
ncbi:MAG: helix-turn-helix domain-containing protein [Firmicutes bacterium]|nr:helix-turn-helix domain-containing protein [Candidatus Fermentithermobacillaceae bacterium]